MMHGHNTDTRGAIAFYNEIDPFAAQVLRELIRDGVIAPGVVDERDIRDIRPDELSGFTQCHFFAGGGVWSYGLRKAGWRDEWPIWTGSCPCQPFSQAGKGLGFDDERHLWPAFDWLIQQCSPVVVAGEQVADKGADAWLDLVQADLEGMGYAFGCVPLASAGFGAPNPRHRTFWMAYADLQREGPAGNGARPRDARGDGQVIRLADAIGSGRPRIGGSRKAGAAEHCNADGLGHAMRDGAGPVGGDGHCPQGEADRIHGSVPGASAASGDAGTTSGVAHTLRTGRPERRPEPRLRSVTGSGGAGNCDPGPTNGFWRDADWLYCRDPRGPRWRPVNRGTFPLAPGTPERVGTLRLSGNAINAEVAAGFAEAMIQVLGLQERGIAA